MKKHKLSPIYDNTNILQWQLHFYLVKGNHLQQRSKVESKNQKINKLVYSVLNCSYTKSTNLKLNGEALKRNWAGWTMLDR